MYRYQSLVVRALFCFALCIVPALLLTQPVCAQQEGLLQIDDPVSRFLERQQVLGRLPEAHLTHRPLSAYAAQAYLDTLAAQASELGRIDRQLLARYRGEVPGPGVRTAQRLVPFAYPEGHAMVAATGETYGFEVGPLAYLAYGRARRSAREDRETNVPVWQNTRGIRAAGHIGRHIFFETRLEENQRRDAWVDLQGGNPVNTTPRLGMTKITDDGQVFDYWQAMGLVGFRSRHFEVRFGRDRNRWGPGLGSVILSNYAPPADQLQIRTTAWRLQYTNLYVGVARPQDRSAPDTDFVPRRFGALHHLAIDLPGGVQLGLFESIMFAAGDSLGLRDDTFDLTYLNPIIFYRAIEADRGSPDNALLGGEFSWVTLPGLQLYGQLVIDELNFDEIGQEWWGNKWGWLLGVHLAGLPWDNLALRLEYARLRPYLYGHRSPFSAYVHYNDVLGHPAGPNATDWLLALDYQASPRLRAAATIAYTRRGRNTEADNYGADPVLPTTTRAASRGVTLLQGVRQTQWIAEGHVGYELLPGLVLEAALRAESIDDDERGLDRYVAPFLLLRWGLPFQRLRY